eukprot:8396974-Alexandrium_andersonii.AAC.1
MHLAAATPAILLGVPPLCLRTCPQQIRTSPRLDGPGRPTARLARAPAPQGSAAACPPRRSR